MQGIQGVQGIQGFVGPTGSTLTIGTGLSGTSYNGSSPVTIAIDSTVATLTGNQTFSNKSISLPKFDISTVTAAGSNQGTATALTTMISNVTTVAASTGVRLPTAAAGYRFIIRNGGANTLNVYPDTGAAINSLAANAAYSIPTGAMIEIVAVSTTQWYTMTAVYG